MLRVAHELTFIVQFGVKRMGHHCLLDFTTTYISSLSKHPVFLKESMNAIGIII